MNRAARGTILLVAIVVDSLKDMLPRLSDEEAAAAFNRLVQECIAAGVQVLLLHHMRKANDDNKRPKALADVKNLTT